MNRVQREDKTAIQFLKEMLSLKSVNGDEEHVVRLIESFLKDSGIEVDIKSLGSNRANLIARLKGNGSRPCLMFSGHMDTVAPGEMPWDYDPYGAQEADGKIYGRGASDMKGGLAAMVVAMLKLAQTRAPLKGNLILAATAGEESGCLGAQALVAGGVLDGVGAMIIGEPTHENLVVTHKGALWLEVESFGKTAHGSMPEQGSNAIAHMNKAISDLSNYTFKYEENPFLGGPTLNIGTNICAQVISPVQHSTEMTF